jgi:hypothetical protein
MSFFSGSPSGNPDRRCFLPYLRRGNFTNFQSWQAYCIEMVMFAHWSGFSSADIDAAIELVDDDIGSGLQMRFAELYFHHRYMRQLAQVQAEKEAYKELVRRFQVLYRIRNSENKTGGSPNNEGLTRENWTANLRGILNNSYQFKDISSAHGFQGNEDNAPDGKAVNNPRGDTQEAMLEFTAGFRQHLLALNSHVHGLTFASNFSSN